MAVTEFAISLIQTFVTNNSKDITELHNLIDALTYFPNFLLPAMAGILYLESLKVFLIFQLAARP